MMCGAKVLWACVNYVTASDEVIDEASFSHCVASLSTSEAPRTLDCPSHCSVLIDDVQQYLVFYRSY